MGIIVNKNNSQNDELSKRISADLRSKMDSAKRDSDGITQDYVNNTEYTKNMQKTSRFGWIWIVLIVLAILSLISILFF